MSEKGKSPEHEVAKFSVDRRAEFRMLQQQLNDSVDFGSQAVAKAGNFDFVTCCCFDKFLLRLRMEFEIH